MSRKKTIEEFIVEARKVHGNKYDYSRFVYCGNKIKGEIICYKHGVFFVNPNSHLSIKSGRPSCYRDKCHYTTDSIIKAFKKVHGEKYDYKDVVFSGIHRDVKIWCLNCKQFFTVRPSNHLHNKTGCWRCSQLGDKNPAWNPDRELVKLKRIISHKVGNVVRRTLHGTRKEASSYQLLGYTRKELLEHIILHPNWQNCKNGEWHIDHIFPISAFVIFGITNLRIINHLSNIQPMLGAENISKNDNYDKNKFIEWLKQFSMHDLGISYEEIMKRYVIRKVKSDTISKYIGLKKCKRWWYAFICHNRLSEYLGCFESEEEAAKNYDYFCLKYNGVQPNFPNFDYSNFKPKKGGA